MKKIAILSLITLFLASCSDDNTNGNIAPIEQPSEGTVFGTTEKPLNVGGPNEQNQVYVDLSGEAVLPVRRDSWDLGFYSGNGFHVVLNGSLMMAAKQLETTDITVNQQPDASVAVGTFQPENMNYIDNPDGSFGPTGFGTIAASEASAKVFLVNLGHAVPDVAPAAGSVNSAGNARGWKKVKVWQEAGGYKIQFADLNSATYQEAVIGKTPGYNHTFFSFNTGVVNVEPEADKWDLNFTTFTNEVFDDSGVSAGAYFYSDFILTNTKGGVTAYMVEGDAAVYSAFTAASVSATKFSADQRAIGANWRNVVPVQLYGNVFFVVKDAAGNIYKIKFISMLDANGNRGFPVFQYQLL